MPNVSFLGCECRLGCPRVNRSWVKGQRETKTQRRFGGSLPPGGPEGGPQVEESYCCCLGWLEPHTTLIQLNLSGFH